MDKVLRKHLSDKVMFEKRCEEVSEIDLWIFWGVAGRDEVLKRVFPRRNSNCKGTFLLDIVNWESKHPVSRDNPKQFNN